MYHTKYIKLKFWAFILIFPAIGNAQKIGSFSAGKNPDYKVYSFTLDEAIKFGEKNRLDIKNQQLNIQIGQTQVNQSKTIFYPKLNGSIDGRVNSRLQTSLLPAEIFGGPAGTYRELQFGTRYNALSSVDLDAVLWDEAASTDMKIARGKLNINKEEFNKSLTAIRMNIAEAYYLVLINKERIRLSGSEVVRAQRYFEEGKQKKINGTIALSDLDNLSLQVNLAATAHARNLNTYKLSQEFLLNQLGLSVANGIQLKDSLISVQADLNNAGIMEPDMSDFKFTNRSEYRIEELNLSQAKLNLKRARKGYLPKLSAYGTIATQALRTNFDFFNFNKPWYPYNYVGLKLSIPVFDGFQSKFEKQEYQLRSQVSQNNLADQQLNLTYEYHTALNDVQFNTDNVKNEFKNMENAKELIKVSELKFKEGVIYQSQLFDTERTFYEAENAYLRSLYDYYMAQLNLKKAKGIL